MQNISKSYGRILILTLLTMKNASLLGTTVADLGFGKGRCPIHQKGAPDGGSWGEARAGRVSGGLPQKIWKSRHSLIHFPGISWHYELYDWVCFYRTWKYVLFKKGHSKQRAGVRTPWTPPLDPPLDKLISFWTGSGFFRGSWVFSTILHN